METSLLLAIGAGLLGLGVAIGWLVTRGVAARRHARAARFWHDRQEAEALAAEVARRETARTGDELRAVRSRLGTAEVSLASTRAALDEGTEELDRARRRIEALSGELEQAGAEVERLEAALGRRRSEVELREQEIRRALEDREAIGRRAAELDRLRSGLQSEVVRLAVRVESLDGQLHRAVDESRREAEAQRTALQAANALVVTSRREADSALAASAMLGRRLEEVSAERDAAATEAERMGTELRDARARVRHEELARQEALAGRDAELGGLRARLERLDPLVRQLEDRDALLQAALYERDQAERRLVDRDREHETAVHRLRVRIAALERLEAQLRERDEKLAGLERRLAAVTRGRDDAEGRERRREAEVETLRAEWRDRDRRFRVLASENEQLVGGLEQKQRELEHQLAVRPEPRKTNGANGHRRPANGSAVPDADDLTAIWGIGPILARRLNVRGIYRFRDIAAWDDAAIERFTRSLGAVGHRIRRDGWVEAARRAHQRKYGAAP